MLRLCEALLCCSKQSVSIWRRCWDVDTRCGPASGGSLGKPSPHAAPLLSRLAAHPGGLIGGGNWGAGSRFLLSPPRWPSAHTACPPAGESLDAYSSHSRQQKVPEWSAREDPGSPHSPAPGASESAQQVPSKAAEGGGALAEEGRGRHHLCSSSLGAAGAGCRGLSVVCPPPHCLPPAHTSTLLHTPAHTS